jgi:uncharacterized membrane protein
MTILLFNDNPVVQKLVALSAQKTKDDLTIASSVEDVQGSGYDLLIIDDALYSDEVFTALKECVAYKSALFMATRGNIIPAGFDNIINKPFLPTDLVETLILIERNISAASVHAKAVAAETAAGDSEDAYAIDLQETLSEIDHDAEGFLDHDLESMDSEMGLDDLDDFSHEAPKTAVLDREEVQEVQGLLEDAESDALIEDDEITVKGIDDFGLPEKLQTDSEEEFDFDGLIESDHEAIMSEDSLDMDALNLDEEIDENNFETVSDEKSADENMAFDLPDEEEIPDDMSGFESLQTTLESDQDDDELDFGDALADAGTLAPEEELNLPEAEEDANVLMDDEAFGDLEFQIQEAVDELEPEDLDMELDAETLEDFELGAAEEDFEVLGTDEKALGEGFDEFDMLDERELKLAIGEEVSEDDDIEIRVGSSDYASLSAEALAEAAGESVVTHTAFSADDEPLEAGHAEGVEALQALLKALSNEDVAKSLKGLNISININFGNDK